MAGRPGWSSVEQLIEWFADQQGAEGPQRSSPSFMIRAIYEHLTALPHDRPIEAKSCATMVSNWRKARSVGDKSWWIIRDLTGVSINLLYEASMKAAAGDLSPVPGWAIPGPGAKLCPTCGEVVGKVRGLQSVTKKLADHQRKTAVGLVRRLKAEAENDPADNVQVKASRNVLRPKAAVARLGNK